MLGQTQSQAIRAVVAGLAVIAAGCGSDSALSPAAPTVGFSAGTIEISPAGAIVGTAVTLQSRAASGPTGNPLDYYWDFGDGTTGSGEAITHVYATEGDFVARLTVASSEAGAAETTLNIPVRSLTARWMGDLGQVSIVQDGLELRGTYQDGVRQGTVEGRISDSGSVTFTAIRPGLDPVTFTGTAGRDVQTLVGAANGRDVNRPWTLVRD
jgi:PKD repeat protein